MKALKEKNMEPGDTLGYPGSRASWGRSYAIMHRFDLERLRAVFLDDYKALNHALIKGDVLTGWLNLIEEITRPLT